MKIMTVCWEDAAELLAIYRPYVEETAISFEYEAPSLEEFRLRILQISEKFPYIKAVDDENRIMGYAYAATFKGRRAYDRAVEATVYVRKDLRRTGCGRKLYDTLAQMLKAMGILNMNACIGSPRGEDPYLTPASILFHERMGFTPVGTFHNVGFKFDRWYDMIWMEKLLGEHSETPAPVHFGMYGSGQVVYEEP